MSHFATLPGMPAPQPERTTRRNDTCPTCNQPVRHIYDDEVAALPATVSRHPVDRATALAAMVTGRGVVVRIRAKHHAYWRRLSRHTIGSTNLAAGDHHLDHVCGRDPPPPPPQPATAPDYVGPPPF